MVSVLTPNILAIFEAHFGVLMAGVALMILIDSGEFLGELEYEDFLAEANLNFEAVLTEDDWQAVSLNYISGTTGVPKGVVYQTRGAYLLSTGNVLVWKMPHRPVYLWTLPMFHSNGWCFPWKVTVLTGTHVCLCKVTAKNIYDSIVEHLVTHLCGAPIVMNMISSAPKEEQR